MSSSAFESFWQAYPKKVGKAAALKKWELKKLDDYAPTIVAHLKKRVKEDKRWKDGFVLDPTTFLNQERWTDEYETIQYKQPPSKANDVKPDEVYPQPCKWQASANRLLLEVLHNYRIPNDQLEAMVAMKRKMGERLRKLYGDADVSNEEWQTISSQGYEWMRKAAHGIAGQTRKAETRPSRNKPAEDAPEDAPMDIEYA
jgi:hypothetical protein